MGSKKKAPKAPDYTALAHQQASLNNAQVQQQTEANRPDQITSQGSLKWSQDPATGRWTQTETLSPQMQAAQDQAMALQSQQMTQVADLAKQGGFNGGPAMPEYNPSGVQAGAMPEYTPGGGAMPQYDQASGEQYAQRFTESLMGRLRPQQQQDQSSMQTKLRLQGLQPGTAAYDRAYKNLLTSQGDVNAQANLQGLMAGGQEARNVYNTQLAGQAQGHGQGLQDYQARLAGQQQDFGQQMGSAENARADYGAQLQGQQQGYGQEMEKYLMPWQTAQMSQGLANGIQGPNFQSFMGAGQGEGAKVMDAAQQTYAQKMQAYNEAAKQKSGKGQSLGSIAGAIGGSFFGAPQVGAAAGGSIGGMFSDAELKENIQEIDDEKAYNIMLTLVPVNWQWKGTPITDSGIRAEQVLDLLPMLVDKGEHGMLMVNYTTLFSILLGAFRHMAAKEAANG